MRSARLLRSAPATVWQMPGDIIRVVYDHFVWVQRRRDWRAFGRKWTVDEYTVSGADVQVCAWALAAPQDRPNVSFTIDGRAISSLEGPTPRPDLAAAMPHAPFADRSGYVAKGWLAEPAKPGQFIRVDCVNARTGEPMGPMYYPRFIRIPASNELPMPEVNRRQRVIGQECGDYFLTSGANQFARMRAAARDVAGRDFDDLANVLDWGCGCGRISRYFRDRGPDAFTGADVDADNVAWCRKNLPFGRFETIPLHPPTQFADGTFDLVIGISVFTHLREPDQFQWLEELKRITRPGAVLLLTVHGDAYLWAAPTCLTDEQNRLRQRTGFVAIGNRQYDADLAESDYYQNIFHNHAYLRKHWSKYFEICDIMPGYIGNQDLMVLRRT